MCMYWNGLALWITILKTKINMIIENKWEDLDDEYDYVEPKFDKPVNFNMATLKRVEGALNRHRNEGRVK